MSQLKITDRNLSSIGRPVVSICCTTYNQEKYIQQCVDSFLMQETTFPVEIMIHDDASTDSTPEIIKKYALQYPKLIKVIQQTTNQRSLGYKCLYLTVPKASGDFIAICEGDDYWTDSNKLQIQYEMLVKNPEISACFHDCVSVEEKNGQYQVKNKITWPSDEVETRDLLDGNPFMTCSAFLRRSSFPEDPQIFRQLKMGDFPLWILASLQGRLLWIHQNMGAYRIHSAGVWSNKPQSEMHLGILECLAKMGDFLPASLKQIHRVFLARHLARYSVHYDKEKQCSSTTTPFVDLKGMIYLAEEECGVEFCEEYLRRATWLFEHHDERIHLQLVEHLKTQGCPPSQAASLASRHFGKYFPNQLIPENKIQKRLSRVWEFLKLRR